MVNIKTGRMALFPFVFVSFTLQSWGPGETVGSEWRVQKYGKVSPLTTIDSQAATAAVMMATIFDITGKTSRIL